MIGSHRLYDIETVTCIKLDNSLHCSGKQPGEWRACAVLNRNTIAQPFAVLLSVCIVRQIPRVNHRNTALHKST